MGSRCCVGLNDSSRSLLVVVPNVCIHSTLAFLMSYLTTCILSIDLSMSSRSSEGLSASQRHIFPSLVRFSLSFIGLRVTNLNMKSSVLPIVLWLLGVFIASIYFAAKLWHHALAFLERYFDTLCQIGLLDHFCHRTLLIHCTMRLCHGLYLLYPF